MTHKDSWPQSSPWPKKKARINRLPPKQRKRLFRRIKRRIKKRAGPSNWEGCVSLFNKLENPQEEYNLQKNIAKLRRKKEMSQHELADMLDCSQATIYLWEHGYQQTAPQDVKRLAEALGGNAEDIICFDLGLIYSSIEYAQHLQNWNKDSDKKWREDVSEIQKWSKKIKRRADKALRGFSRKGRKEEFNKKPDEFDSYEAYWEASFQHLSEIDETAQFRRPWRWRPGMEIPKGAPPKKAQNWLNKLLSDHFQSGGLTVEDSSFLAQDIVITFLDADWQKDDLEASKKARQRTSAKNK